MAFTIFQAGSTLYGMDQRGSRIALTLPTNVTLDATRQPHFAVFGRYVVMVNSPSRPLTIDANLNVRVLCPDPPSVKPTVAGVAGGTLSGTFKVRQTYFQRDSFGALISESDFGPDSSSVAISSKYLGLSAIPLSSDVVTGSRFYRTTDGTAVYFKWIDLDGNVQTSIQDDLSDAGLATLSAPSLGTPPDLALLAEFKSRLFGVSKAAIDDIYYSEVGAMYAWPADNILPSPRSGSDNRGVTGFMRRRDALGFGRANGLYQITGTSDDTIRITVISEDAGIESGDSVAVYKNVAFFVWKDGLYTWDENGVQCITDGKVRRWFTRDDTFNLSRLRYAFGQIDPFRKKYRVFLASAGSVVEDCWIEYDFIDGKVWGPHTSHAMNPSSAFRFVTDAGLSMPMIGGTDGYCRVDRALRTDDTNTGIDYDVVTARDDAGLPYHEKYFGLISLSNKPQIDGTLIVQSAVGEADALRDDDDMEFDLRESSQSVGRVGVGKAMKLRFRNNEPGVDVSLRGYEIDPVYPIGKR